MTNDLSMIELDLGSLPQTLLTTSDPVVAALRQRGYTSVSTGLRTAQVNGGLYDLSPEGQVAIAAWLGGEQLYPERIRLFRHQITAA